MNTVIIRSVIKMTAPLVMVFSLYLLFRGHDLPGGGFIAGLVSASAILLEFMAFGLSRVRPYSRMLLYVFAAGLVIALLTGLGSMVFGFAFLKSGVFHMTIPFWGEFEIVTATVFDVGVYFVVVGIALTVLTLLSDGEENA